MSKLYNTFHNMGNSTGIAFGGGGHSGGGHSNSSYSRKPRRDNADAANNISMEDATHQISIGLDAACVVTRNPGVCVAAATVGVADKAMN